MKKRNSILFKFGLIYFSFAFVMLAIIGFITYFSQMKNYRHECEKRIRDVGEYLAELMVNEGDDIERYQEYYMDHYMDLEIPRDFEDYYDAYNEFEDVFSATYPGMVMGQDIELEDTTQEVQDAYFVYSHEYWLLTYEMAREAFDLPYTYYLILGDERGRRDNIPSGKGYTNSVTYLIDKERRSDTGESGDEILFLGNTEYSSKKDNPILWKTWETGEKQDGYTEWKNEDGHTWAYYTPVIIEGVKLGVVVTEVDVETFNEELAVNSIGNVMLMAAVMLTGFALMFIIFKRRLLTRLIHIEAVISEYSEKKDKRVVERLDYEEEGGDEIDMLAMRLSSMINDLSEYMKTLVSTTRQLQEAEEREVELTQMVNIDALTGIRNKNSYDREAENLQIEIKEGIAKFGIAVADLNFLKKINDTYGHENGNTAIKNACKILCHHFKHSQVFRIGGDEFAIIMKNEDYENAEKLYADFVRKMDDYAELEVKAMWQSPTVSIGYARFNPMRDGTVKDVFKRADASMYEHKERMHATRK